MIDNKQAENLKRLFDELRDESNTVDFGDILNVAIGAYLNTSKSWCLADQLFSADYAKDRLKEAIVKLSSFKDKIETPGVVGVNFKVGDAYLADEYPVTHSITPAGIICDNIKQECYVVKNQEDCRQDFLGDSVVDMLNSGV